MNANRKWIQNGECYELHFTKFYDDEVVLKFVADDNEPGCYIFVSEELNVEFDYIHAESIEEAKKELELKYAEHLESEVSYYEELLRKWEE